jgi:hypothetical protein
MLRKNIEVMNSLDGFNVVIICCSSQLQANYWQKRLEDGRGAVMPSNSVVLAVEEDWPGGAGNALGTLYAYQKGAALAKERFNMNMDRDLQAGKISIGLYHTAGKGTRLAPLPGAENNNKPGVKLPATITLAGGSVVPITILEAVIKQTSCYAKSRLGRVSVFWGDQVFIPTAPVTYTVTHHVDILCSLGPMMTAEEWKEKGMDKYGLIAQNASGGAAQVEKVDHATAVSLLAGLGAIASVGASLGSFSVSNTLFAKLLDEFSDELASKSGKLDSDPHLWMPMTLDKPAYLMLMGKKGIPEATSKAHYDRIQAMMGQFLSVPENKTLGVFGPVDVGQGVYWWDYGQLKLYGNNALLLTKPSEEASSMRMFYGIDSSSDTSVMNSEVTNSDVSDGSCISGSRIGFDGDRSKVKASALCNVQCKYVDAEGCILINVSAERITAAPGSILYNIVDTSPEGIVAAPGEVRAGVFAADASCMVMKSNLSIDGGKAWETVVESNEMSFEQVHTNNKTACPLTLEKVISETHASTWKTVLSTK